MLPPLSTGVFLRDVARLHTHLQRLCVSCCEGNSGVDASTVHWRTLGESHPSTLRRKAS